MPAKTPPLEGLNAAKLSALGEAIRAHRKRQKVSAVTAAEAAGVSRVTLHRIERGEPSVTMGAYLNALTAIGLELALHDPLALAPVRADGDDLPAVIQLDDYPQLKQLAWQVHDATELSPEEALNLYERNWRHLDQRSLDPRERALLRALVVRFGGGRLLV
ncbi:helix-turn-helix domain-containing protein [Aquincola sp. S2]|uniref:Helix-turn-helix domain-containing protein n=1 Tax=Pseudaquabacterium terrae TaxID=2732868 RepID=A0ABX2EG80_9BURK|nr:helix-turn-helix domain-containing protein [Aquabacterium terrae]NRF67603.1 helix-turn-helix domain-containing protein [Aquabacterium terrae]